MLGLLAIALLGAPLVIPWFQLDPVTVPGIELDIQPFGFLVTAGVMLGGRVAELRGERFGVPAKLMAEFLLYTVVFGLPTGMLLNMLMYQPHDVLSWARGELTYPGMSSYGGFFAGTMAALVFRHRKRVSLLVMGDLFCYAFPVAWFFGRLGCFVVHDHPGVVSDFPLAVGNYFGTGEPRHDLGFYEVLWSAVMIPLVVVLGREPRPWGFFTALLPLCYAPVRFFLDFLRETPEYGGDIRYFGLTPGQYWSVIMLVAGILVARRVAQGPAPSLYFDDAGAGPRPHLPSDRPPGVRGSDSRRLSRR